MVAPSGTGSHCTLARERAVVDAADLASLERFAERVLTAATLDDVL